MADLLVVDIETTSACDIAACGAEKYAKDPTTKILCIAYGTLYNDLKLARCDDPKSLEACFSMLIDTCRSGGRLIAHNAAFERACLSCYHPVLANPAWWIDSAMLCGACGRPHALREACYSLGLPPELEKDARGKRLLNMFSIQSSKLYIGGPGANPAAFDELCEYCRQDVRAEAAVYRALMRYHDDLLDRQWRMDCAISDAGIPIDVDEIEGAKALYEYLQADAECAASELTDGVPMRSTVGLRKWTAEQGWPLQSFARAAVDEALENTQMCDAHPKVAELLRLRKTVAGTAGKKFDAFLQRCMSDGRIRGSFMARVAHTGRYAGRGIQPQNLPRGFVDGSLVDFTRRAAYRGKTDLKSALEFLRLIAGGQECDALASLCRDAICAPAGKVFVVADYSAVEARVLAWLARERWVEDIFAGDGKIYERTAARMYKKAPEDIDKHERMAGKIATLALGYGGGRMALQRFAEAYGVRWTDDEAQAIVDTWRGSRPATKLLWDVLNRGFMKAACGVSNAVAVGAYGKVIFRPDTVNARRVLRVELPSGRDIFYWNPTVDTNGEVAVETYGSANSSMEAEAKGAGMTRVYGGLLTENVTQAVAFDLLLNSMLTLHEKHSDKCRIVMHIHDEIVVECSTMLAPTVADIMKSVMETPPKWAAGLKLNVEPEIMMRYKK